jgi:hypothetical protein
MICDEAMQRFTESLAAPLGDGAANELARHLADCPACAAEAAALGRVWDTLEHLPEEQPGAEMSRRFAAFLQPRVAAARRGSVFGRTAARLGAGVEGWLERLLPRRPLAQAGLTAATLAIGFVLGAGGVAGIGGGGAVRGIGTGVGSEIGSLRQEVRSLSQLVTLSLLKQDSASERLRGVSFGRQAGGGDERVLAALLDTLARDPDVNVRLAAVDALAPTVGRPMVRDQLLQQMSRQASPMVQIALIDVLLAHDRVGSRPRLLELAASPGLDPTVREYLHSRLHQVS